MVQQWQGTVGANANILPITSLSHVTHNREAAAIRTDDKFVFIPKAKVGKAVHKTVKVTQDPITHQSILTHIPPGVPIFPHGRMSWWGISSTNWHETEFGCNFRARLVESRNTMPGLVEADYLKDEPDSRYGNHEFIVSLSNLMKIYKQSRTDTNKEVCLKNAGTLHYKYEICYVIMAAMEGDIDHIFPGIYNEPHNNGKLICGSIPSFKIKHPFTCSRNSQTNYWNNYSWETLAFALYFPDNPEMVLKCPKEYCREIETKHSFCTSKQPTRQGLVCPNELLPSLS